MASLKIEIDELPQGVVARLIGEASIDEADELDRNLRLLAASKPALAVLDLAQLSYIASMGIGALVALRNDLSQSAGRVVLAAPRPLVLDTFKHAGLLRVFPVYPTIEDALRAGQPPVDATGTGAGLPK